MTPTAQPALPFGDEPVPEIALPQTPLIVVVVQIRFPAIASITRQDFIGPFQERIRSRYPVLRQVRELGLVVTPEQMAPMAAATPVWRFEDKEGHWRVSLAPEFVALDTSAYLSRADLLSRLGEVLQALRDEIRPATFDRLGVRYVDRVPLGGPAGTAQLAELVRPEICGIATTELGSAGHRHSLCDAQFEVGDAVLHGRWGVLPAGELLEPLHREPLTVPSWLLDLDMYTQRSQELDPQEVLDTTRSFAQTIYRFFRWAVTDKLLREAGGRL